jgi:hypothetical protein
MSREREDQERPCLHCMIVELIDDFFAEYPATAGSDKVDTDEADEVIDAVAKVGDDWTPGNLTPPPCWTGRGVNFAVR